MNRQMTSYLIIVVLLIVIYCLWNQKNETCKIYWFYKTDCVKCNEMKPEWVLVEDKLSNTSINLTRINADEPRNKKMLTNFKIETTPYIVKVFPNGTRDVYSGRYKYADIIEWVYEASYDCLLG
jgi:hypothetical protein